MAFQSSIQTLNKNLQNVRCSADITWGCLSIFLCDKGFQPRNFGSCPLVEFSHHVFPWKHHLWKKKRNRKTNNQRKSLTNYLKYPKCIIVSRWSFRDSVWSTRADWIGFSLIAFTIAMPWYHFQFRIRREHGFHMMYEEVHCDQLAKDFTTWISTHVIVFVRWTFVLQTAWQIRKKADCNHSHCSWITKTFVQRKKIHFYGHSYGISNFLE